MKVLTFDIGGTNIRFAVGQGKKIGVPTLRPVPRRYADAVQLIAAEAKAKKVDMIVGGLPGPLTPDHGGLLQSTHLPTWVKKPFVRDVQKKSRCRVMLENDSALVALGEAVFGAGKGYEIVAYIGFGTGIGGARIVHQRIDANAHGFEPGHHIIDWNVTSHNHPSPHPGDWESFISGTGIFFETGRRSETITDKKFWKRMDSRVARGLVNVAMFWSPDVIVLGGSLMNKLSIPEIRREFARRLKIFPRKPNIKKAELGQFSGLYGALALSTSAQKR